MPADVGAEAASLATCERVGNLTQAAEEEQLAAMYGLVMGRLAPADAAADGALDAALAQLKASAPELHVVVVAARGQNASLPAAASAATLAQFYEEPWTVPAPAKAALSSRSLAAAGASAATLVARAQARLLELEAVQQATQALPEVQEALALAAPGGGLNYNHVTWEGGSNAYTRCNLQRWVGEFFGGANRRCTHRHPAASLAWPHAAPHPFAATLLSSRTPQFLGACIPRVPCSNTSVADVGGRVQVDYSCTTPGVPSPSPACGDLCDSQNICAALCECAPGCGPLQASHGAHGWRAGAGARETRGGGGAPTQLSN